ncbi:hypothetical protein ACIA5G_52245 [Amycolatopsis sp. NPDC051758]|uniref:hypothetical protein n=1 Tax=Amycolatopsis sp. NPDC051758 TaxID=3363935 RepID=UPI0037BD841F
MTTPPTSVIPRATPAVPGDATRTRDNDFRRIVGEQLAETVVRVIPLIRARLFMPNDVAPDEGRVFVELAALPPFGTRILHNGYEYVVADVLQETGNVWVSVYLDYV